MMIMSVILLAMVMIFAEIQCKKELVNRVESAVYQNKRYVRYIDNQYQFSSRYSRNEEDIVYFVILDGEGNVVDGEYPEKFPVNARKIVNKKVYTIENETNDVFYVMDLWYGKFLRRNGDEIYLRGVIAKEDGFTTYRTLIYIVAGSIAVTAGIVLLWGMRLIRRVSKPLEDIRETARKIEQGMNLSQRMEYTGNLCELELLVDTENKMLEKMEYIFLQQERFSSDVAHELRTPIAVIRAQCEYALEKPKKAEELKETIEVINRQSRKISDMIWQLLELSRLEHKDYKLEKENISLVEMIESACEDLEEQMTTDKKVGIVQKLEKVSVEGDICLISIAIQNLLQNAYKFSKAGTCIEVEAREEEHNICIIVKDQGKGMTEAEQRNIFKRFYKADESRNSKGYGLGLALTQKIMEVHGGTIEVESQLDIGSQFKLVFPK